jgi:hypothetical protein
MEHREIQPFDKLRTGWQQCSALIELRVMWLRRHKVIMLRCHLL